MARTHPPRAPELCTAARPPRGDRASARSRGARPRRGAEAVRGGHRAAPRSARTAHTAEAQVKQVLSDKAGNFKVEDFDGYRALEPTSRTPAPVWMRPSKHGGARADAWCANPCPRPSDTVCCRPASGYARRWCSPRLKPPAGEAKQEWPSSPPPSSRARVFAGSRRLPCMDNDDCVAAGPPPTAHSMSGPPRWPATTWWPSAPECWTPAWRTRPGAVPPPGDRSRAVPRGRRRGHDRGKRWISRRRACGCRPPASRACTGVRRDLDCGGVRDRRTRRRAPPAACERCGTTAATWGSRSRSTTTCSMPRPRPISWQDRGQGRGARQVHLRHLARRRRARAEAERLAAGRRPLAASGLVSPTLAELAPYIVTRPN